MACVVRNSFLLISICLRSTLCENPELKVGSSTGFVGETITIPCATDKTPQNGVYMYKKGANETIHQVFYYYKDKSFTPKTTEYEHKVNVKGIFPHLTAIFSNLNTTDTGLYWCEFNLEDKVTIGNATLLLIDTQIKKNSHDIMKKRDTEEEKGEGVLTLEIKEDKKCQEDPHVMIVLIVCVVLLLLCIIGFIFVILKVKGRWGNKEYSPSNKASDSVYEEMKRSNSDAQPSGRMFLNPDYQSTKLLR